MDFLWWFAQIVNVWWFAEKIYVLSTVPKLMVAVRLLEKHRVLKMDSRRPPLLSGQTTVQHSSLDKPPHSSLHQRGLSCPTLCRNRREVELRARLCGCWAESQHKLLLWSGVKPAPREALRPKNPTPPSVAAHGPGPGGGLLVGRLGGSGGSTTRRPGHQNLARQIFERASRRASRGQTGATISIRIF